MISILGAGALAWIAMKRNEPVNALWLMAASLCTYAVAYRFYARYLEKKVLPIEVARLTPAVAKSDGLDFVPTHRYVLFGHHFAAIAGAGPLVGPVLSAQMGYLPGTFWILGGVVFAGAVQDMIVLFFSTRREGKSLGEMVRLEMGEAAGFIALVGVLLIMIIILAVLALVVVKALAGSPWGTFTVFSTLPIAVIMGVYGRVIRPGKIAEMSAIGFTLLMGSLVYGRNIAASASWAPWFTFSAESIAMIMVTYGFVASVLPVWLVLAPRDYLSTFLKIGAIIALAFGIVYTHPVLKMPALTQFVHGSGPVFSGSLFPFLFITIACGSVSGFHALIASGTTPKLLETETEIRFIGYGAMLMESFVAMMALIAASSIEPGVYFAMNSPAALIGKEVTQVAATLSSWGFSVTPELLTLTAKEVGESSILHRAGGAPTLAVGMAQIFSKIFSDRSLMAFWYHFAILFEALFILTAVDAGTRVARFMIQDLVGTRIPSFRETQSWRNNLIGSAIAVGMWGYILFIGVIDPLGGINTLWPLFGISNQMLAAIALVFSSVILFKMKRERYAWVTGLPALALLVFTLTAGFLKLFSSDPSIGFLAHAQKYQKALDLNELIAPAVSPEQMARIISNDRIDAALAGAFVSVVIATFIFGMKAILKARKNPNRTDLETVYAK